MSNSIYEDIMSRVTLKDVAMRAGVSYQTVSKVLSNKRKVAFETDARIRNAASDLGYQPNIIARNLRNQNSNLIGYAWRRTPDGEPHPLLDRFLYHTAIVAEAHHFKILPFLIDATDDSNDINVYRELYERQQVEGFVLDATNYDDPRIAYLIAQNIPFTSFGRANDAWPFCWVDVDSVYGIELVVNHLVERGHQRIAMITWQTGSMTGAYREQGYWRGLQNAGIDFDSAWLVRGEHTTQTGVVGAMQVLSLPVDRRPTAIVCVCDLFAVGAIYAVMAAGLRVGQDIAITGFDDLRMDEYLYPTLTSVRQPIPEVGRHIVELLLNQISEVSAEPKGILLKPTLVVRESS